jgi:hypothetical protein
MEPVIRKADCQQPCEMLVVPDPGEGLTFARLTLRFNPFGSVHPPYHNNNNNHYQ